MISLTACPICEQTSLRAFLTCKDYTVSHETFNLTECTSCGFVFTNPRPEDQNLGRYYQSSNYISHSEGNKSLMDTAYRLARSFTLRWKLNLVQRHSASPPDSLLDFGCGTGTFLQYCKQQGIRAAGIEPAPNARTIAARNTKADIVSDISDITSRYDAITLWHVLEHVADLNGTLEQLKSTLSENGTMFIAVPNHNSADAKTYKEYWAAYDVPRHLWHFSQTTMTRILNNHGMKVKHILPMPLDAYYVSLLSEQYRTNKRGFTLMAKATIQAFKSNRMAKKTNEYSSLIYIVTA